MATRPYLAASPEQKSAWGREGGTRSGEVRREAADHRRKQVQAFTAVGWSAPAIAVQLGVSIRTIRSDRAATRGGVMGCREGKGFTVGVQSRAKSTTKKRRRATREEVRMACRELRRAELRGYSDRPELDLQTRTLSVLRYRLHPHVWDGLARRLRRYRTGWLLMPEPAIVSVLLDRRTRGMPGTVANGQRLTFDDQGSFVPLFERRRRRRADRDRWDDGLHPTDREPVEVSTISEAERMVRHLPGGEALIRQARRIRRSGGRAIRTAPRERGSRPVSLC